MRCSGYVSDLGDKTTWWYLIPVPACLSWQKKFNLVGYLRSACLSRPHAWGMAMWCIAVGNVRLTCLWGPRVLPTGST